MHKRTCTGAAGVSPPWLGNRTCNGDSAHNHGNTSHVHMSGGCQFATRFGSTLAEAIRRARPETADVAPTNTIAVAVSDPRRAYARCSCTLRATPFPSNCATPLQVRRQIRHGGLTPAAPGLATRHSLLATRHSLLATAERQRRNRHRPGRRKKSPRESAALVRRRPPASREPDAVR